MESKKTVKRVFDMICSLTALIVFAPLIIAVYLVVLRKIGSPVFYRSVRPGRHAKLFKMVKFRSMSTAKDQNGKLLPDAERLSGFGQFLRKTSLDELPELWNVLKGDMSLVGPRPLLTEYLPLYSETQARRHEMRPGITGWAQINGRNAISWEQKFKLDVWYVDNQNLWLDIKIIAKTIFIVIKSDGVSAEGEATMPKFKGSGSVQ